MSFSLSGAAPLAQLAQPMDHARLLGSPHVALPTTDARPANPFAGCDALCCLVTVTLGRAGWRDAALALGGCFDPGARQPL